jgi:hypothetical protein
MLSLSQITLADLARGGARERRDHHDLHRKLVLGEASAGRVLDELSQRQDAPCGVSKLDHGLDQRFLAGP